MLKLASMRMAAGVGAVSAGLVCASYAPVASNASGTSNRLAELEARISGLEKQLKPVKKGAKEFVVMPVDVHNNLVIAAYMKRGYLRDEAEDAADVAANAVWHGIRTHHALKAIHLDDHMGSGGKLGKGCIPGAEITVVQNKYKAVETWDCHSKLGQAVAKRAMARCMEMADEYGVGIVSVDNAFHYLWGGGYVMDAAKKGYIAYTCCPAALTEVVPFMGKAPTLGTNPHSWGFPTTKSLGYPIVIDWATSVVAMGRVQVLKREKGTLPPDAAVDKDGKVTTDPEAAVSLIPFGRHKGYGLALIDELYGAYTGMSLPTIRNRFDMAVPAGEKQGCTFFFMCIKPDAMANSFAMGRDQDENVKAVIDDVLGHGNDRVILPGQVEAGLTPFAPGAKQSEEAGGLLFTAAEVAEFADIATDVGFGADKFNPAAFGTYHF